MFCYKTVLNIIFFFPKDLFKALKINFYSLFILYVFYFIGDHLKQPYCQKPFKLLLDHEKGCQLLGGKPIVMKTLNLDNVSITEQVAKVNKFHIFIYFCCLKLLHLS